MVDAAVLDTYRGILTEIRFRLNAVDDIMSGRVRPIRLPIAQDIAYLQFRMICELIAIASLVAHGDIQETESSKIQKAYEADWIIKKLESIHPNFYPTALENQDAPGWPPAMIARKDDYLSKSKLIELYRECGGKLHRGSVVNFFADEKPIEMDKMATWFRQIINLLYRHSIFLSDNVHMLYFNMPYPSGDINGVIFERDDNIPPAPPT